MEDLPGKPGGAAESRSIAPRTAEGYCGAGLRVLWEGEMALRLGILHYHLNPGGVTRVIENHLLGLDAVWTGEPARVVLLHGGRSDGFRRELLERLRNVELATATLPELDYDELHGRTDLGGEELAAATAAVLEDAGLPARETILHVHNHGLGKNRALCEALGRLAERGYALLLHIHDFAEDLRVANYRRVAALPAHVRYPQGPAIHYAVLNGRDHNILADAGVPAERLHLLPNPAPPVEPRRDRAAARQRLHKLFDVAPEQRFLLYPVRGIRRKNVGEAVLLSVLARAETVVGLTLAPINPAERGAFQHWNRLVAARGLPFRCEVGGSGGLSFAENLAAADGLVTTSLAEGFGMVFLEAWQVGLPLAGRDLPEITLDFVRVGLRLDRLQSRLEVPIRWLGAPRFAGRVAEAFTQTQEAYGLSRRASAEDVLAVKVIEGCVDFGDLDEEMQAEVVERVDGDPAARRELIALNGRLATALSLDAAAEARTIAENARVVEERFSPAATGRRLSVLYRELAAGERGGRPVAPPHPQRILDRFLELGRFRLIRGSAPPAS